MYRKIEKVITLATLLFVMACPQPQLFAAGISSINDLKANGNGTYTLPAGKNNGFLTSDNSVLNSQWYAEETIEFLPGFIWGSSEYGMGDDGWANVKFFRMWNPGSTKENAYVEFTGREGNGMFKFALENTSGNNALNKYSSVDNLKNVLKAGTKHRFQYDFKDSSPNGSDGRFRMWLDGAKIFDVQGFKSLTTGGLKRIFIMGPQNEWGSKNNSVIISGTQMIEGKTFEQAGGSTQPPVVTPPPPVPPAPLPTVSGTTSPVPTPTPAPTMAEWFKDFLRKLIAFLQGILG